MLLDCYGGDSTNQASEASNNLSGFDASELELKVLSKGISSVIVQASSNLKNWIPISTNTVVNGTNTINTAFNYALSSTNNACYFRVEGK